MAGHAGDSRLLARWRDDPADPGWPALTHPDVQRLVAAIAPGSPATDLGGTMSLNVRLHSAGLVLRAHVRYVSRRRLLTEQAARRRLADLGPVVLLPWPWHGATVFPCGGRYAELEAYLPYA